MDHRPISYLRPLRRRWGLTQKELGFLIGAKNGGIISRVEGLKQLPNTAATLAIALIFDTAPSTLFPTFIDKIREAVHRRATDLYEELQGNPARITRAKLDFLEQILARTEPHRTAETTV
jgi:hypothetical protein